MKKFLCIVLSMSMLLSIGMTMSVATDSAYAENQGTASIYHTNLVLYYQEIGAFPSHYGGAYVNQSTGNLIINLTERTPEIEQLYYTVCQAEAGTLEFQTVTYSLNDLFDLSKQVSEYSKATLYSDGVSVVTGMSVIQADNRLEVYTANKSRTAETALFNAVDHPDAITVKQSDSIVRLEAASLGSGVKTRPTQSSHIGSIGYLAYRNINGQRQTGFVTAGHVANEGDTVYQKDGTYLGSCKLSIRPTITIWYDSGDVDVAFIPSTGLVGSTINNTSYAQESGTMLIPAEGSTVYKSGASTGVTSERVYTLYFVSIEEPISGPFVRRILVPYYSDEGDSGSIVYAPINGKGRVVGIHQGYVPFTNGVRYGCVISASNIQSQTGIYVGG